MIEAAIAAILYVVMVWLPAITMAQLLAFLPVLWLLGAVAFCWIVASYCKRPLPRARHAEEYEAHLPHICDTCRGQGQVGSRLGPLTVARPCPKCGGEGQPYVTRLGHC